jgi:hypothetical protein
VKWPKTTRSSSRCCTLTPTHDRDRLTFRQGAAKPELVGRRVRIEDRQYKVLSIGRVTQGPIHKGEIVGIVVEPT